MPKHFFSSCICILRCHIFQTLIIFKPLGTQMHTHSLLAIMFKKTKKKVVYAHYIAMIQKGKNRKMLFKISQKKLCITLQDEIQNIKVPLLCNRVHGIMQSDNHPLENVKYFKRIESITPSVNIPLLHGGTEDNSVMNA